MPKLSKSDYQRLVLTKKRITGVDKNMEGSQMAHALFLREYNCEPTNEELRDFYSSTTNGHRESITPFFEAKFGDKNPVRAISDLRLAQSKPLAIEELTQGLEFFRDLTLYCHDSLEEAQNSNKPFKVYRVLLN